MNSAHKVTIWGLFWEWAGRVPLRQKIIGITVAPLVILGSSIAWWVSNQLGGWLSYLLSEERVIQAMSIGMRGVFIITGLAALVGLGIALFLTWLLTRPVLDMTTVARRVKNGDLVVRAPVWANDEIGELGRAFNDMISGLDTSRRELETFNNDLQLRNHELAMLYRLSDMANQSYSMQQTSEYGLKLTLENTAATAGLILTLTGGQPTVVAHQNLSESILENVVTCLPGFVDANGALAIPEEAFPMWRVQDIDELPAPLALACQEPGYQMVIVTPIRVKQNLLGILAMLYIEPAEITAQQQRLVGGICNQLGIALQNSQLWEELRYKEQLRAQLLNKVVSAQEEERRRISRELHDETGQALTSLLVQLRILEKSNDLDEVKTHVEDMRRRTAQTLQEIRRLAADLRPAALDDLGLISALEGYIYEFSRKTGIAVDFGAQDVEDMRLPHEVEIVLYRIVQESLTNVARHANASAVDVAFHFQNGGIHVLVRDNGQGMNTTEILGAKNRSLGILGMRERIELLGGAFELKSNPGTGTEVSVTLALEPGAR
jgi:signal transduction histidine kinase